LDLAEVGRRASSFPGLLSLPSVKGKGDLQDQVLRLLHSLRQIGARVGLSPVGEQAAVVLGLDPETAGLPVDRRRARALELQDQEGMGRKSGITVSSFKKRREPQLMGFLATELLAAEWRRLQQSEGRSLAVQVDWLPRFEQLYRIWTPVYALRTDLKRALAEKREGGNELDRFATSSLYHFARYWWEVEVNTRNYGGMVLLLDAQTEGQIADAISLIRQSSPFHEREGSALARAVSRRGDLLIGFEDALQTDPAFSQLLEIWKAWIAACECQRHLPATDCDVHKVISQCRIYVMGVQQGWYDFADWYGDLPTDLLGDDFSLMQRKVSELPSPDEE
jgi:hypothetical protein